MKRVVDVKKMLVLVSKVELMFRSEKTQRNMKIQTRGKYRVELIEFETWDFHFHWNENEHVYQIFTANYTA